MTVPTVLVIFTSVLFVLCGILSQLARIASILFERECEIRRARSRNT